MAILLEKNKKNEGFQKKNSKYLLTNEGRESIMVDNRILNGRGSNENKKK